jgi:hypothetical protein
MATRGPSGGGKTPSALPDLTDDEDDDLDQDTAISDPAAMKQLLASHRAEAKHRAETVPSHPPAAPQRGTPVGRGTQIGQAMRPQEPAQPAPRQTPPPRQTPVPQEALPRRNTPVPQEAAPSRQTPVPEEAAPQRQTPARFPGMDRRQTPAPVEAPPSSPRGPKAMQRTDIVPEFRRDLQIQRVAGGVQIVDPVTGTGHSLNEYEVSLARMLNGKRPVFEVLDASERLGIPINVESLQKFIGKLEAQGLIQPPETLDAAIENAWPSRGQWESNVRTLFQSGIRFLRQGKPQEAISYFEALLAEDPDNIEARELLEMSKSALQAPQPTIVVAPPSAVMNVPFGSTPSVPIPVVGQDYVSQPLTSHSYPHQIPGGPTPQGMPVAYVHHAPVPGPTTMQGMQAQMYPQVMHLPQPVAPTPPRPQLSKKLLIPGLIGLVVLGALLGFVVLRKTTESKPTQDPSAGSAAQVGSNPIAMNVGSANTQPAVGSNAGSGAAGSAATPSAGSATNEPAGSGSAAAAGSADAGSATMPAAGSNATTEPTGSGATGSGTGSAAGTGSGAGSATGSGSGAGSDKKPDDVPAAKPATEVTAPMGGDVVAYLKGARNVKKGEKLFAITRVTGDPAKIKELTAKVAEMQKLAKQDEVYKEFLQTAKAELAKERKVSSSVVTAPKAGKAIPKVRNGAFVRNGQTMAVIQ